MSPVSYIFTVIVLFGFSVVAQEKPYFTTPLYEPSAQHRQDVCERHAQYYSGSIELRDALKGLELRPMIRVSSFFPLEDGTIDPNNPGLIGVILDELGKRAFFRWRDSFAVTYGPGEGHSYTDLYIWGAETYDFVADWCLNTIERLTLGLTFPRGFYDGSYILVGKRTKEESSERGNLFSWLKPFKPSVWWTIIATLAVSAVVFSELDNNMNEDQEPEKRHWNRNFFHSFFLFSQQYEFEPKTPASSVFALSLAFWSLIVLEVYVANLSSYFIADNSPAMINGIEDVIKASLPMCINRGSGRAQHLRQNYPRGIYIDKDSNEEVLLGVRNGDCAFAVTSSDFWESNKSDNNINGDCELIWIGRTIKYVEAGFSLKSDNHILCTNLIHDVLNLHMHEMIADGFVDMAWEDHRNKYANLDCSAEEPPPPKLTFDEMAGAFLIPLIAAISAIVITLVRKCRRQRKKRMSAKIGAGDTGKLKVKLKKEQCRRSVSVLKKQLAELQVNHKAMETTFFKQCGEKRQQLSTIISLLQDIQD